ncbi:hypothetical protein [Sphingobacterium sp.]
MHLLPCLNAYDVVCGHDEVPKSNDCLFCSAI